MFSCIAKMKQDGNFLYSYRRDEDVYFVLRKAVILSCTSCISTITKMHDSFHNLEKNPFSWISYLLELGRQQKSAD